MFGMFLNLEEIENGDIRNQNEPEDALCSCMSCGSAVALW